MLQIRYKKAKRPSEAAATWCEFQFIFIFTGYDSAVFYQIGIISNATRDHQQLPSRGQDLKFLLFFGTAANCMYLLCALIIYGFSLATPKGMDEMGDILKSYYFFAFCSAFCLSMYFVKFSNHEDLVTIWMPLNSGHFSPQTVQRAFLDVYNTVESISEYETDDEGTEDDNITWTLMNQRIPFELEFINCIASIRCVDQFVLWPSTTSEAHDVHIGVI